MQIPGVIKNVVNHDLCIGCGTCVSTCPSNALEMDWNIQGFLVATVSENQCDSDGNCLKVCPFNPVPGPDYKNEDDLSAIYLGEASQHHKKIGRYLNIYAGYAPSFRATSSSGGMATYIYEKLFDKGLIDHVISVGASSNQATYYEFTVISRKEDLLNISKTRYYPVTMAGALDTIKRLDGRVAISGVGCFIKSIRLAQENDLLLRQKIAFLVGIICGGIKSKFFTEYLANKAGGVSQRISNPEYRVKDPASTAMDYRFSCIDIPSQATKAIRMREVGDMWGTGLFKANACDYCDDVTTELADISLGDAWLEPYSQDGRGHNVIVTRTANADDMLQQGLTNGEIHLEVLQEEQFLVSQQGSFNHRHDGLGIRIAMAVRAGYAVPPKRVDSIRLPFYLKLVQLARRRTRSESLKIWERHHNAVDFDRFMRVQLTILKVLTKVANLMRKLKRLRGVSP